MYDIIDGKCFDDTDGNSWVSMNCVHWMLGFSEPIEDFWEMLGLGHTYNLRYDLQKCHGESYTRKIQYESECSICDMIFS